MANLLSSNLVPFKIRKQYFEEYIGLTPLSVLMGSSPEDAIQVFETDSGEGLSYRVSVRKELDYMNPVVGFDQAAGAEQQPRFSSDEIKLDLLRFVDTLRGVPIVKQQTPIDMFNSLRPLLINVQRRNLVASILKSATFDLYAPTSGVGTSGANVGLPIPNATAGTGPSSDRVVYSGITSPASRSGIQTGLAAMNAGTAANPNTLTVAHLRKLKLLAIQGGDTYEAEARIRPVQLKTKRGFPEEIYIYLMDSATYSGLVLDPAWNQFMYRGVIQNGDQPEGISGARYRGMVEGVLVYECPELSRYRQTDTATSGRVFAWNLFLGAQAFGVCWARRPWFEMEERDFKLNISIASCEIRGQKALMFDSFKNTLDSTPKVERGIIHHFVKIA